MKVVYSCYGGAHTSIVAAAIHLGFLSDKEVPSSQSIMKIPFYDKAENKNIGKPLFMGLDQNGHEIYVWGMGANRSACSNLIYDYANLMGGRGPILIVNSIALINLPIRIGGFLSKKLKLVALGKPLTAMGIKKKYHRFVGLVGNVKAFLDN